MREPTSFNALVGIGEAIHVIGALVVAEHSALIQGLPLIPRSFGIWSCELIRSGLPCEEFVVLLESRGLLCTRGWGEKLDSERPLTETLLPARNGDVIECDELWSFVRTKDNKCWIWLVLCRRTRQVLAWALGDRSAATCKKLWDSLPKEYKNRRCFSDFWSAYECVLPARTHHAVGKETGETNHIERFNNTLRQRLGCLVRQSLSFSKHWEWHRIRILLFLLRYNRGRRAQYLASNPERDSEVT